MNKGRAGRVVAIVAARGRRSQEALGRMKTAVVGAALTLATSTAMAQPTAPTGTTAIAPLQKVAEIMCSGAGYLQGPIGFAAVAIFFAVAWIMYQAGNRQASGRVVTVFIGGLGLASIKTIIDLFGTTAVGCANIV